MKFTIKTIVFSLAALLSGVAYADGLNNLIHAHSHNDYAHKRPLLDALDGHFYSVEADIYLVDGKIIVTHNLPEYEATLKENYLNELQKRVDEKGSVYGDGKNFLLWVDVKRGGDDLKEALTKLLAPYSMLSTYTDDGVKEGPVTVVLTGDATFKEDYVTLPSRKACRDSNYYSADDPKADNGWTWYAVSWGRHFKWKGNGPMPADKRELLQTIVDDMHAKGRKIRFYSVPDMPIYWTLAMEVGIDLINSDHIPELSQFLKEYKGQSSSGIHNAQQN